MKNYKHFSIRLTLNLVRIIFWLTIGIFLFLGIISLFELFRSENLSFTLRGIPFHFNLNETGSINSAGSNVGVELTRTMGWFHFENLPVSNYLLLLLCSLPLLLGLIYLIWLIKQLLINVDKGNVFVMVNSTILKKIAYLFLAGWIYSEFGKILFYFIIMKKMKFDQISFNLSIELNMTILFVGLFFLVLSYIFQKGIEIEEDNRLTI